jgi:hypothetical protein
MHQRSVTLDARAKRVSVIDHLRARGSHDIEFRLHLDDRCRAHRESETTFHIATPGARLLLHLDPTLEVEVLQGDVAPSGGWLSHRYHEKVPTETLVGRRRTNGDAALACTIEWLRSGP